MEQRRRRLRSALLRSAFFAAAAAIPGCILIDLTKVRETEAIGAEFAEGDAYHPPQNVEKMRRGIPLEDADRWPWLERLSAEIDRWLAAGKTVVLACSALKQGYRDVVA